MHPIFLQKTLDIRFRIMVGMPKLSVTKKMDSDMHSAQADNRFFYFHWYFYYWFRTGLPGVSLT